MQGMFYGAFQGKKRDMLPLLSKIGEYRNKDGTMMKYIFDILNLPDNWNELEEDEWVKVRYANPNSMNINYLQGGLFSDLNDYMLMVEGMTCVTLLDYNSRSYWYSPYESLEIQDFYRKIDVQNAAKEFKKTTGQLSITKDKQDYRDGYKANAAKFISNEVLPPLFYGNSDFMIKNDVLLKYTGNADEIVISDNCTSIGNGAFKNNETLKRVIIPKNIKIIKESAFENCTALEQIELNEGLQEIEDRAFNNTALEYVNLPNGLTTLSDNAFRNCTLHIPSSIKSLNENNFFGGILNNVTKIEMDDNHPVYSVQNGVVYRKEDKVLIKALEDINGKFEIPIGVKKIAKGAFMNARKLTEIRIPEGVEEIADDAFKYCTRLKKVELPEGLLIIGSDAFGSCEALSEINLPISLHQIESSTFHNCKSLKQLDIPNQVEIHNLNFSIRNGVPCIDFVEATTIISADLSVKSIIKLLPYYKVKLHLTLGRDYTGMVTPAVLENLIEQDAQEEFAIAESFAPELWDWLPDLLTHARYCGAKRMETHLTTIEENGLAEGKKRQPLTVAEQKKRWLFEKNRDGSYTATAYIGPFSHAVIPDFFDNVKVTGFVTKPMDFYSMDTAAFNHSIIRTLTIPTGVTSVELDFNMMPRLEFINVIEGNNTISSHKGILYTDKGKTLYRCPISWKEGKYDIPDGVKKINQKAFYNCDNEINISIPNSVTEIGKDAFVEHRGFISSSSNFTIHAPAGSYAEQYAAENGIKFEAL